MENTYTLDNLARDIAFEIHLGGDRFSPSDIKEYLSGISQKDLFTLRERILYHAYDFAPDEPSFTDWARRAVGFWLDGIDTAESLGRKVKGSWFDGLDIRHDRERYFLFDDGRLEKCVKATAEAQWGKQVRQHIIKEYSSEIDVAVFQIDNLIGRYGDKDSKSVEFITHSMLPEGNITGLSYVKDVCFFNLDNGEKIIAGDAYRNNPGLVMDILRFELDERNYRQLTEMLNKRQDIKDFKRVADELIERVGKRVSLDFLYDEVELVSNEQGRIILRRDVDDLSYSHHYYICTQKDGVNTMSCVNEDYNAGTLSRVLALASDMLEKLPKEDFVEIGSGRIDFADGPVVSVPEFTEDGPMKMKVSSLFYDVEGNPSVIGVISHDGVDCNAVYPLSMLSDKGVLLVKEASDKALGRLQSKEPLLTPKNMLFVKGNAKKNSNGVSM